MLRSNLSRIFTCLVVRSVDRPIRFGVDRTTTFCHETGPAKVGENENDMRNFSGSRKQKSGHDEEQGRPTTVVFTNGTA